MSTRNTTWNPAEPWATSELWNETSIPGSPAPTRRTIIVRPETRTKKVAR